MGRFLENNTKKNKQTRNANSKTTKSSTPKTLPSLRSSRFCDKQSDKQTTPNTRKSGNGSDRGRPNIKKIKNKSKKTTTNLSLLFFFINPISISRHRILFHIG